MRATIIISAAIAAFTLAACTKPKDNRNGEELAKVHCATCHAFTSPELLDKQTWKNMVLPSMAPFVGVDLRFGLPLYDSISPVRISVDEFEAIAEYYVNEAPGELPKQDREPVHLFTDRFSVREVTLPEGSIPATSFLKIDPGNRWIYAANGMDSALVIYDANLTTVRGFAVSGVIADMYLTQAFDEPGDRQGILTNIGIMNPNDLRTGSVEKFMINYHDKELSRQVLLDSLPRPIQTTMHDLDDDGAPEYLVCGFGHTQGALYLADEKKAGVVELTILRELPGAIKTVVRDFNDDGLPDIMALMAQAEEGVYLFINQGDGTFITQELLSFPPVFGSTF